VLPWADRVVVLRDGLVEVEGSPSDVARSLSTD
jgi:ABC-type hemin transport system ATPase subunit